MTTACSTWIDKSRSDVSVLFCLCVLRYVERKNFLERVDHRQFELEKAVRLSNMKQWHRLTTHTRTENNFFFLSCSSLSFSNETGAVVPLQWAQTTVLARVYFRPGILIGSVCMEEGCCVCFHPCVTNDESQTLTLHPSCFLKWLI